MNKSYKDKLANNLLYVRVSLSMWTASVRDKKRARRSEELAGADRRTGSAIRYLMKPEIKAIHSEGNALRKMPKDLGYSMSLATGSHKDTGYIIPSPVWDKNKAQIELDVREWKAKVMRFVDPTVYFPALERDMKRHGSDANRNDYPATIEDIQSKFSIDVKVGKFSIGSTMLFDILDESINDIESATEDKAKELVQKIEIENLKKLQIPIKELADKLRAYGNKGSYFKGASLEAIDDIAAAIDGFNISSDPRIQDIVNTMKGTVIGLDGKVLRESEVVRASVTNNADAIVEKIESYF